MRSVSLTVAILSTALVSTSAEAMNRAELVDSLAADVELTTVEASHALDALLSATAAGLSRGDRVSLLGLGSFSISKRSARTGRASSRHGQDTEVVQVDFVDERGEREVSHPCFATLGEEYLVARIVKLTARDAEEGGLTPDEAARVLDSFVSRTLDAMDRLEWVELDDFGTFYLVQETPVGRRTGRNPQTGKEIKIAAKRVAKFKAGKALAETVK